MTQEALQTIIQLLLSMVAVLAGDNPATKSQLAGIQNLMTNMTGGLADEVEPPARRVSFDDSVGQADNDGFQTVSRRRARKNQSPPEPDTTKGGGKTKSFAAVVGAGLSSGKGKGKGVPQPPKQQGKAAKAPPGAPARPQLRDRDWNGAIFSYDKAASQLNSLNGSMLVHVRDAEQADALMMMLTGAGAKCSARLVGVDPDGTLKLPIAGESKDGKDVRIHHFACVDFLTPGTLLPTLKHAPTAAKAVPPVRPPPPCALSSGSFSWRRLTGPGRPRRQGCRSAMGAGHAQGRVARRRQGCLGLCSGDPFGNPSRGGLDPRAVVETLLGSSGDGGVFLEPAGREHNVNCMIEWVGAQEKESWPAQACA